MSTNDDLPPMPSPPSWHLPDELVKYSPAQMQAYAREAVAAERERMANELRIAADLDGFGCACETQRQCNTCGARSVLGKVLMPIIRTLAAPLPKEQT